MSSHSDQDMMHPQRKIFLQTVEKIESPEKKVWIGNLKNGDVAEVKTRNTLFKLKVIDSKDDLVEVESSREESCFICSFGKLHVLGPIVENHCLSLEAIEKDEKGDILTVDTSTVSKITVNGQKIM